MKKTRISLSAIPTELILEVFKFIPSLNLLKIRLVCKEFNYVFSQTKHVFAFTTFISLFRSTRIVNNELLKPPSRSGDKKKEVLKHVGDLGKDFSSIDRHIEIVKKLKITLQVQEILFGIVWNLEKDHYLRTSSSGKKLKEKGVKVEEIKRSQIPDGDERLVLVSENIRKEFRDLCNKIYVSEFNVTRHVLNECIETNVSSTVLLSNKVKVIVELNEEYRDVQRDSVKIFLMFSNLDKNVIVDTENPSFGNLVGEFEPEKQTMRLSEVFLHEDEDYILDVYNPRKTIFEFFAERMLTEDRCEETIARMKSELGLKYFDVKKLKFFVLCIASVFKSWIEN